MRVSVEIGLQSAREFARTVRALLEGMMLAARREVQGLPPLYRSGVKYGTEREESFKSPKLVAARGWGDCAHLVLWRVAELRNRGVAARIDVWIQDLGARRVFHVRVRLPDGSIEDPSVVLGMKVPKGLRVPT